MLFDAHTRSFTALGGICRRGIYDNMKTAVDKVNKGKGQVVNARFATMCSHYLFDADFCNVASGWGEAGFRKAMLCAAATDPADTYLLNVVVTTNTIPPTTTAAGERTPNTPAVVATPLPPRNRSQTG